MPKFSEQRNCALDDKVLEYQRTNDGQLASDIIREFDPLVRTICRSYIFPIGSHDDLMQEGRFGLFKAMRDFRTDYGVPFYRFAIECVRRQCLTAIKYALRQKNVILTNAVSLNQPVYHEESRMTLQDCLPDHDSMNSEELLILQDDFISCEKLLRETLSPYEFIVLKNWSMGERYEVIAAKLHRTGKSIDNALQRAKKQLLRFCREDPYFITTFKHFVLFISIFHADIEDPVLMDGRKRKRHDLPRAPKRSGC